METDCSSYCLVISAGGDLARSLLSKCPSQNKKMLDNRCDGNEYLSKQYQSGDARCGHSSLSWELTSEVSLIPSGGFQEDI